MDKSNSTKGRVTMSGPRTKIVSDYAPDHSGTKKATQENRVGKMGGSVTNLDHSLSGASAKQRRSG